MFVREYLKDIILAVVSQAPYGLSREQLQIVPPKNAEYGDYATNLSFQLTKMLKKPPVVIAEELVVLLNGSTEQFVFSQLNGFINAKVANLLLFGELAALTDDYGRVNVGNGQRVLLEYVSANPTGPLHIGHGRWAVIGDIVARVLSYLNFDVYKEFYLNDAGNQIANFRASVEAARSGNPIPEDGYHGAYVKGLAASDVDPVTEMIKQQRAVMSSIGVDFDNWFSESTLHQEGALDAAIVFLQDKGLVYEQEGALWFKSEQLGDDKDRVLVRSNKEKTYFAADIAYHKNKLDRGFERLINIWGADHHGYIRRVQAAIKALRGTESTGLEIILGQLVNLFRNGEPVRMSKRTGEIITLQEVAEEIGVDATRYYLAMRSADNQLDFDLELAKSKSSDNPVYYVQYAHARICSILRQQEVQSVKVAPSYTSLEPSERKLLLKIVQLPEELESIAANFSIHRLCVYAEELARLFHNFYHECRVVVEDEQLLANRVHLIKGVKLTLQIVLNLLAIEAPEKM